MRKPIRPLIFLLLAAATMFFTNLGATRLWDDDEAIFSQSAWEMLERGDYIVPYFNSKIFPDKPILMYWLIIGAYKVFGATEFAARVWSAVFGLGTVLLTWRLGRTLYSSRVGLWAGLILASSLNFDVVARAATPDSLLIFFSTLALLLFAEGCVARRNDAELPVLESARLTIVGYRKPDSRATAASSALEPLPQNGGWLAAGDVPSPSWRTYAFVYAAMGLAVLVKGPVGLILPTAGLGLFLLCMTQRSRSGAASGETPASPAATGFVAACVRQFKALGRLLSPWHFAETVWRMRPLTALLAVAAIAGPWYAWVGLQTDGEWLRGFFGIHNFGRFLAAMENHRGPIFYYVPAILIGFFPWSVFLLLSVWQLSKRIREHHAWRSADVLVACWVAVWVGFFSLASTKLPSYILPAYPGLALLTACFVSRWIEGAAAFSRNLLRSAWVTLGLVGAGLVVAMPIVSAVYLQGDLLLGIAGVVPLCGACACFYFSEKGRRQAAAVSFAAAAILFVTTLFGFCAPRVDRYQSSELFAEVIRANMTPGNAELGCFGYFRPSLVFYTKRPIVSLHTPQEVDAFFKTHPQNAFLFTMDEDFNRLGTQLPGDVSILEVRPRFLKSKNVFLLGRPLAAERQAGADSGRRI